MAKSTNSKPSKVKKNDLKSQVKISRVATTRTGTTPGGAGFWRLAGNHNETLVR